MIRLKDEMYIFALEKVLPAFWKQNWAQVRLRLKKEAREAREELGMANQRARDLEKQVKLHEQENARLTQENEQLKLKLGGTGAGPEPPLSKDQLEQSAHVLESCSKL